MNEKFLLSNNLLSQHVTAINKCVEVAKKNIFEICIRLSILAESDLDNETNGEYTNIVDFAAAHFGFARSTTLNYIKIAREYLTVQYIETGDNKKPKIEYHSICTDTTEDGDIIDYKIGQLNALGKTTAGDFEIMHSGGIISPDMSADAIKKAVKAWYAEDEPEDETEDEPEDEPEDGETPDDNMIINYLQSMIINYLQSMIENCYPINNNQEIAVHMKPQDFTTRLVMAIKALGDGNV